MIGRAAIVERVSEWGLREEVVEKDYILGWMTPELLRGQPRERHRRPVLRLCHARADGAGDDSRIFPDTHEQG